MDASLAYYKHFTKYDNPPLMADLYFKIENVLHDKFIDYCENEKSLHKRILMAAGKQLSISALGAVWVPCSIIQIPAELLVSCTVVKGERFKRYLGVKEEISLEDDLSKKRMSFIERIKFDLYASRYFWTQSYKTWQIAMNPDEAYPNVQGKEV